MFKNGELLFCAAKATKTVHFFGNLGRHWLVNLSTSLTSRGTFLDATFCRRIGDDDDDDDDELYSCVDVFS